MDPNSKRNASVLQQPLRGSEESISSTFEKSHVNISECYQDSIYCKYSSMEDIHQSFQPSPRIIEMSVHISRDNESGCLSNHSLQNLLDPTSEHLHYCNGLPVFAVGKKQKFSSEEAARILLNPEINVSPFLHKCKGTIYSLSI